MENSKKSFAWWLGLFVALATALAGYLVSCTTTHSFRVVADKIENPNIVYQDSVNVTNLKK